jgi:hypothetical protein
MASTQENVLSLVELLDPFQGFDGEIYIRVPGDDIAGVAALVDVPLSDRRVGPILRAELLRAFRGSIPSSAHVANLIECLEGIAFRSPRREVRLDPESILNSPFAKIIIEILKRGGLKDTPKAILSYSLMLAEQMGLRSFIHELPVSEDQLGCRLRQLMEPLRQLNVAAITRYDTRPRRWSIEPLNGLNGGVTYVTCVTSPPAEVTAENHLVLTGSVNSVSSDPEMSEPDDEFVKDAELAQLAGSVADVSVACEKPGTIGDDVNESPAEGGNDDGK